MNKREGGLILDQAQELNGIENLLHMWFLDVPGPVGQPFSGVNLTTDSCKLTWCSPEDDGGSAITNYIIEKRESDRMGWTAVSYTVTRHNAVVQGLIDGKGYFFRIAAENIIGMGPFIESERPVLIKDPICEFLPISIPELQLSYCCYKT